MRACGFCSNDGGRAPRPGHRISAAQFLANAREKLRRNLPEPVIACQVPIVPPTLLPFRKDAKDGVSRDDGAFATNMAAVREPWVGEVLISDTMENAKRTIDKVHQASQWDIPSHPDGSPADANADAAAFQLRYWAGSDFYPVWDPVKEAHLPVWAQDVMDDDFLAKCRRSAFWEMTRLSKVSNIFP